MKKFLNILLVLLVSIGFAITTVNAGETGNDKNEEKVATTKNTEKDDSTAKEVKEKSKITVYLFRRSGCPHCADELTFLDSIYDEYKDKIDIVVYETGSGNNSKLLNDVAAETGVEVEGVPYTVIGDQAIVGYAESISDSFIELINFAYDTQSKDVVKKLLDKNDYSDLSKTDIYKAMDEEGLDYVSGSNESKKSKNDTIIVAVFFGVIAISFGALIYFSRKK